MAEPSRQQSGGLLEAAPDAIVAVRVDGLIALVNAQAERLFGYGREEMVGQPVEILVPDAARDLHPRHRGVPNWHQDRSFHPRRYVSP